MRTTLIRPSHRTSSLVLGALAVSGLTASLMGAVAAPAIAAPATEIPAAPISGPQLDAPDSVEPWVRFDIGNRQTLVANAETGGLMLATGAAGLTWDSAIATTALLPAFGTGWSWGVASVQQDDTGQDSVYVPQRGIFATDPASPSGLAGYPYDDVVYLAGGGTFGGTGDTVGTPYASELRYVKLGTIVIFDEVGNPITTFSARHDRVDREFTSAADGGAVRYLAVLEEGAGVRTTIDYRGDPDAPVITHPDGSATVLFRSTRGIGRVFNTTADQLEPVWSWLWALDGDPFRFSDIKTQRAPSGPVLGETHLEWNGSGGVTRIIHNAEVIFERAG
jgi:hypothetical protein